MAVACFSRVAPAWFDHVRAAIATHADFGFVGRSPNKYAMFVGGSIRGNRLAGLEYKTVLGEDVPGKVRELLEAFKAERQDGEIFADWFERTRTKGDEPTPEQFHVELAERARAARARDPRTHAVLGVDPTVPYGAVDAVVDALRVGGVTRFSLSRPAP